LGWGRIIPWEGFSNAIRKPGGKEARKKTRLLEFFLASFLPGFLIFLITTGR
jgi:hypothetical protein